MKIVGQKTEWDDKPEVHRVVIAADLLWKTLYSKASLRMSRVTLFDMIVQPPVGLYRSSFPTPRIADGFCTSCLAS
jgi:hypothetical protein